MDLWQIHIFCKVVEHGSFSGAGRAIHLSQPTISSHIQALEQHFGCRLLDRMAKAARPTPAGDILLRYAKRLLALRDEAEAAMAQHQGSVRGVLRVGGSTIPGNFLLPPLIGGFTRRYPDVNVSLEIADSDAIVQRILTGDLEVGVVGAEVRERSLLQEALIEDDLRLIVPNSHPWAGRRQMSLERLADEAFIARERGSGTLAAVVAALQQAGSRLQQLKIVAAMGSTTAVIQAIKAGIGVSILSPIAVQDELSRGTLAALAVQGLHLKRSFYLTRHRQRTASPLGEAFCAYLRETLTGINPQDTKNPARSAATGLASKQHQKT